MWMECSYRSSRRYRWHAGMTAEMSLSHRSAAKVEIDTPHGPALVHLYEAPEAAGALVLGHGAGGGFGAKDLVAATGAALEAGLTVAQVEQPYLVAGRRSAGARVACRTAAEAGAIAVLCLAFPVHPPGRPEKTRLDELDAVEVPVLVVQGDSDPFGMPPPAPGRKVVTVPGNHSLKGDLGAVAAAVQDWLPGVLG